MDESILGGAWGAELQVRLEALEVKIRAPGFPESQDPGRKNKVDSCTHSSELNFTIPRAGVPKIVSTEACEV
jgi:hypothetical protein